MPVHPAESCIFSQFLTRFLAKNFKVAWRRLFQFNFYKLNFNGGIINSEKQQYNSVFKGSVLKAGHNLGGNVINVTLVAGDELRPENAKLLFQ